MNYKFLKNEKFYLVFGYIYSLKLHNNLFVSANTFKDATRAKIIMTEVFNDLLNQHHFRPGFSSDLSRYIDHSSFFMEKVTQPDVNAQVCCLGRISKIMSLE